ncbi:endo-1,4-beta-xylanase [Olivibacter sp. SDN3]|uniref:endo-1,4-beta-xylanase n=1 Tax=Olivibacter sp. SDN3 TaxID=2764720 RepID=UPI001650DB53|nr:endo-1,4-beta-xylanase [Olivibacter sp. SDN3]QNL47926.1 endo-1,4-beta-xylanase [Olivibacter sp. SDN3]
MKSLPYFLLSLCCIIVAEPSLAQQQQELGLKDYYHNLFPIGVAVNGRAIKGDEAALIKQEFNSITAENAMKMGPIHPEENRYNWGLADSIVHFASANNLRVRGHTLLWHQQTPKWIFVDENGDQVSKELLLKRLREHILAVVGRYKGKIYAWDVVNEAIDDNPEKFLRESKWMEIIGEEVFARAFEYAHEADPDALLFYNDYNSERPEKRERILRLLKNLTEAGVPIHGVGLQGHWSIFEPSETDLEEAIERYASLGLQLHITELDMSVYPWEKERRQKRADESDAYTPELEQKQIDQFEKVFGIFRKYAEHITNVTFWNVSDRYSWLDHYPVHGRKNYPLLFDQNLQRKKAYWKVVDFKKD